MGMILETADVAVFRDGASRFVVKSADVGGLRLVWGTWTETCADIEAARIVARRLVS